jgi:hypothetical protein
MLQLQKVDDLIRVAAQHKNKHQRGQDLQFVWPMRLFHSCRPVSEALHGLKALVYVYVIDLEPAFPRKQGIWELTLQKKL